MSVVKFSGGRPHPVIFKNLGLQKGRPHFRADALAVNDFPTEPDRAISRSGDFFRKMLSDHRIIYAAPGPAGDYDKGGYEVNECLLAPQWQAVFESAVQGILHRL